MSNEKNDAKENVLGQIDHLQERVTWLTKKLYGNQGDSESEEASISGELREIKTDLAKLRGTIEGWQGSLDKGKTAVIGSVIAGIIGFIIAKVTGG